VNALDRKSFAPVSCELPLWHDTEPALNDKLAAAGAMMKISFKASEKQPEEFFAGSGPKADQNLHQSLAGELQQIKGSDQSALTKRCNTS
jgi:hypothetical protein